MSWSRPNAAILSDGRLHLQHGPIDLIIEATAQQDSREHALAAAQARFQSVLFELVDELPDLRLETSGDTDPQGRIACQMVRATKTLTKRHFITPMAAVAGAVADEVLEAITDAAKIEKAYVNNGGDIALYLAPGQSFTTGLVANPERPQLDGRFTVRFEHPMRGIATSGRHGRSLSLGIADAVTVLAANAATADAAATIIANCVDLPGHPAVTRQPACELDPDSDLGTREVTTSVGKLSHHEVALALSSGLAEARQLQAEGLIHAAVLTLEGQVETCNGNLPLALHTPTTERAAYA
ncbi:UPF0280 family protein [Pelagibius sp. Alg239-R121]|uniref:UPF0280 family protein n=1 Tax=Pelagibius sp. Alg239-R121 TaxID=2993448 RepID=UPI0024A61C4B|nr:UPF0280 family protein [Pelagibius sp. Alg239-R121]